MYLKLTFTFISCFLTAVFFAQNKEPEKLKITGNVKCEQTLQALEFASAVLVPSDNTKDLTGSVSDDKGHFEIIASPGKYTLEISMIGYEKYHQSKLYPVFNKCCL